MKTLIAIVASALFCVAGLTPTARAADIESNNASPPSAKLLATRQALRNLWTNHIFWVRAAVVAKHDHNTEAEKVAEAQVVDNARQIADAIVPFYGKEAGGEMSDLLSGHWSSIKAYLDATDSHNKEGAKQAEQGLYDNANEIAKFLSKANPHWPYDQVDQLLMSHAKHHIAQINDIYDGKYEEEAKNWKQMRKHMDELGDTLANGLAAQFPDKF